MKKLIVLFAVVLMTTQFSWAKLTLPALMSSHMVLQQQTEVTLWGKSTCNEVMVKVDWCAEPITTSTDKDGKWEVKVSTPEASYQAHQIQISDADSQVTLEDVLMGEVWVCSGQSNMQMPVKGYVAQPVEHSLDAILDAPVYQNRVRVITVPRTAKDLSVKEDFDGHWVLTTPKETADCTVVGYFFARQLTKSLDVPVGIIHASWGGTRIESFMDRESILSIPGIDREEVFENKTLSFNNQAEALYNNDILPIHKYTAKGFLWYQGESNVKCNPTHYAELTAAMVRLWRKLWGNDEMPFYCVQLCPFRFEKGRSQETQSCIVQEQQMLAYDLIDHYGVVPTLDIGEEHCVHPAKKLEVSQRLANLALAETYRIPLVAANGPRVTDIAFKDSVCTVTFNPGDDMGLCPINWPGTPSLKGFELAGEDKVFHVAEAYVVGRTNQVEVKCGEVSHPVAVRYGFRNYVEGCKLTNNYGIPAFPFRSDNW